MEQKDKELLLKDLCARLPYKCKYKALKKITHWHKLTLNTRTIDKIIDDYYDEIKPYLRPMSSMTEEEKWEYTNLCFEEDREAFVFGEWATKTYYHDTIESIDWLNKNHFDYRGLIEKGLAIEVTEENNPYKE